MKFLLNSFLDFFYPSFCPVCGDGTSSYPSLCGGCFEQCHFLTGRLCECCGYPLEQQKSQVLYEDIFDTIPFEYDDMGDGLYQGDGNRCLSCVRKPVPFILRSPLVYNDLSKNLILQLKYADRMEVAQLLGNFMMQILHQYPKVDVLIPVPLYWTRLWGRRYNQATLICRAMKREHGHFSSSKHLSVVTNNLMRIKPTQSQGHQHYRQRMDNMRGAFHVKNPKALEGKTIALIDDVYTTGATLRACARALQHAGVKTIYAFTVARVLKGTML